MQVQVIKDSKGKAQGIYIPIDDWEKLKKQFTGLKEFDYGDPDREQLISELKQSVSELKLIDEGKLKARLAKELLDSL
ncbi:MAG: hypothetical protein LAT75_14640 [Candidatus Cyclonatronum sp.]|uniref:hypothetical protein n=1 Tax=Cyclonatronum sp. TaxID=3024185 RepID=UPI0025B9C106|nr:hypothetical protein [Cyclonatronum sp.]MCH8488098.1 hypothetical protein [Cyclonatronum sp.]